MKKNYKAFRLLAIILCFCCFGMFGCSDIYHVSQVKMSDTQMQGIQKYSYEEIQNRKTTLRQPVMEVLERNLPRAETTLLEDTFVLPDFETRTPTGVSVTFSEYPGQNHAASLNNFEKYMLLRQSMYYRQYAQADAEAGTLKKHPAADAQYGAIPGTNNAVKKRIVTDPLYRNANLTTGLYMPAGEVVSVTVKNLKPGEKISVLTHLQQSLAYKPGGDEFPNDSYFPQTDALLIAESQQENPDYASLDIKLHPQYARQNTEIPVLGATFQFTENKTYQIGSIYGGQLHISCPNTSSPVELLITGAVETPHFILGVTSVDYFEKYLRNAPGVLCSLDVENGQLVGPALSMRKTDDILKVAYMWHSNFVVDVSLNGRQYNYGNILKFDRHVPAGAAVALTSTICALPDTWLNICLNFASFKRYGSWGTLHEVGHMHATAFGSVWGMGGSQEGEVRNNALIVLTYAMTGNMDPRVDGIEHGETAHPYTSVNKLLHIAEHDDFNEFEYFEALSLYANLIHQLSPEKFAEMLYSYSLEKSYASNKRADFAYRLSLVYGLDFRPLLNEIYKANITEDMFTQQQRKEMDGKPAFWPIASYYANGVGKSETARKLTISFAEPTEFDFQDKILCPKPFKIVSFKNPQHGKLERLGPNKVRYLPPKRLTEADNFSVICKIENGLTIELPIRFYFNYGLSTSRIYENVKVSNIEDAIALSSQVQPTRVQTGSVAGIGTFNSGNRKDYVASEFSFIASQTGRYQFYLKSDDIGLVQAKHNGSVYTMQTTTYTPGYNDKYSFQVTLEKGDMISFYTHLLNNGGQGFLKVGVQKPGATSVSDIATADMLYYQLTEKDYQTISKFGWQPVFLDSIKNFTNTNYHTKTDWKILEAPAAENGYSTESLIDGKQNTIFHSKYSSSAGKTPMPHTYVVDMGKQQQINFFEVSTRNNVNSYIHSYALYGSLDNQNFVLLQEGAKLSYQNLKATISFETQTFRYLRFVARSSSGGNFTVISELSAGIQAKSQQVIAPMAQETFISHGFHAVGNAGNAVATQKGSTLVMQYYGDAFSIYADTHAQAGMFRVRVDGKDVGVVDLAGEERKAKLVFASATYAKQKHTVEIIALNDKEVNLNYFSIAHGASLLNAANIYKERALGISLAVFICLFMLVLGFIIVYFTLPSVRGYIDGIFHLKDSDASCRAKNKEKQIQKQEEKIKTKLKK